MRSLSSPTFTSSQPLRLTCFWPQHSSFVGGSCQPTPCKWRGIKAIEARAASEHTGAKRGGNKPAPRSLKAYGLVRDRQLLSSLPSHHARTDTSCSGDSVEFGWILHAVFICLLPVTQAPRPEAKGASPVDINKQLC